MLLCSHFFMAQQALIGQGVFINEISRSHQGTPQSIGLLSTSDQPGGGTPS